MIWLLVFAAIWLGCGYVAEGYWYREFKSIDWFILVCGPIPMFAFIPEIYEDGICWNWITKPDLSATQSASSQNGQATFTAAFQRAAAQSSISLTTVRAMAAQLKNGAPYVPTLSKSASTEPVVGYRVWNLVRKTDGTLTAKLKSCTREYEWPLRKRLCRDTFDSAGIHAVKHLSRLENGVETGSPFGGLWQEYTADVAGEVWLWGEVTEAQLGYLAEFAYPKQLWVPEETDPLIVMELEENYGVPVTMRKEFKKHQPMIPEFSYPVFFSLGQAVTAASAASLTTMSSIYTRCVGCGTVYDMSFLVGCTNPACKYSVNYNPFAQSAPQIWGAGVGQAGSSFGVQLAAACACGYTWNGNPPQCPKCFPPITNPTPSAANTQAIVPYTPPKP